MAFEIENFKEVGGRANFADGGQVYSVFSNTDALADMHVVGYLNELEGTLNIGDMVVVSGTDGGEIVHVLTNTAGVITTSTDGAFTTQDLTTAGFLGLGFTKTNLEITGTNAYQLADGYQGQVKYIFVTVAASTPVGTLTPANYADGTSVGFNAVGEQLVLKFAGTQWHTLSITNTVITP